MMAGSISKIWCRRIMLQKVYISQLCCEFIRRAPGCLKCLNCATMLTETWVSAEMASGRTPDNKKELKIFLPFSIVQPFEF